MLKNALPEIKTILPGPKAKKILDRRKDAIPGAIKSVYPCVIEKGEGAILEDVDGNIFLDWVGGVGVLNIGYSHPELIESVREQAGKYFHAMVNIVTHEGYIKLAEKMNEIVPVNSKKRKTMFANSGAEAVENAVKIARSYTGRQNIIVFSGAFHGRTLLASAMTAKKAYSEGTGPFPEGIFRVNFPYLFRGPDGYDEKSAVAYYIEKLEKVFDEGSPAKSVAAVVVEPVQGEGGFVPAPIEWVKAVRHICDKAGILLIADEVQTGFARSGKMFVSNYWKEAGCAPDIIATAKSIAGGIPLSAITASDTIFDGVKSGIIGGTFGGNALACAAALKVIEIIQRDKLCDRSLEIAKRCKAAFEVWQREFEELGDVRGIGCMMGIEFVTDKKSKNPAPKLVANVVDYCVQHGLLVESAGEHGNVLRFLCPLVITNQQLERGLEILRAGIENSR